MLSPMPAATRAVVLIATRVPASEHHNKVSLPSDSRSVTEVLQRKSVLVASSEDS